MNKNALSEKIKELRIRLGYNQAEFGKLLGVSNRAVSKWENEISMPSMDTVYKICKLFNVSFDSLLSGEQGTERLSEKPERKKAMPTIRELYKTGRGPSSSHTMGPEKAAVIFRKRNPDADSFRVVLLGSLAQTGRGHRTDFAVKQAFAPLEVDIEFDCEAKNFPHPNTMEFYAYSKGKQTDFSRVISVGGGQIVFEGETLAENVNLYPLHYFSEIAGYCEKNKIRLYQYVEMIEGKEIWSFLAGIWDKMKKAIQEGLSENGQLPGTLCIQRKAGYLFKQHHMDETEQTKENRLVCSYAFAVSEQNAGGGEIVTAPTCGACGVLPAVLYYYQEKRELPDSAIHKALATAAVIGNIVKTNASISGAECGCQAEIGTACAMASAALGELFGMSIGQIEYSAEIAIEHHLGLTCDPIGGYVQIPCIERNAVAAMRAINAVNLANFLSDTRKISFDLAVQTMYETGRDLGINYRETGKGGLAKLYE